MTRASWSLPAAGRDGAHIPRRGDTTHSAALEVEQARYPRREESSARAAAVRAFLSNRTSGSNSGGLSQQVKSPRISSRRSSDCGRHRRVPRAKSPRPRRVSAQASSARAVRMIVEGIRREPPSPAARRSPSIRRPARPASSTSTARGFLCATAPRACAACAASVRLAAGASRTAPSERARGFFRGSRAALPRQLYAPQRHAKITSTSGASSGLR